MSDNVLRQCYENNQDKINNLEDEVQDIQIIDENHKLKNIHELNETNQENSNINSDENNESAENYDSFCLSDRSDTSFKCKKNTKTKRKTNANKDKLCFSCKYCNITFQVIIV